MAMLFTACVKDEHFASEDQGVAMTFSPDMWASTRASVQGAEAAATLGNSFVVYGNKKFSDNTEQTVFNGYTVNYIENSSGTTNSNSAGWEYVGQQPSGQSEQTIKYWDFSASKYMFSAYSVGNESVTIKEPGLNGVTMSGTEDQLSKCYISSIMEKTPDASSTMVKISFRSVVSRMRIGFYEKIPGYAVKDVTFYIDSDSKDGNCSVKGNFIQKGTLKTIYSGTGVTTVYDPASTNTSASHSFGTLKYGPTLPNDKLTENNLYVGTLSSAPTYAEGSDLGYYTRILPNPDNTTPLVLKVSYKLVSTDGSGQVIQINDAEATIPAAYCQWKSNYSYTYLFKFTDNKLKPITFDAYGVIENTADNQQGTITTFGDYSITTYQKGSVDNQGVGYKPGTPVEVSVVYNVSTPTQIALNSKDGVTPEDGKDYPLDYVVIYHQKNQNEWIVETDYSESTTPVAGVYKETVESITADGHAVFTPDVTGTYRIEYMHKASSAADAEKLAVKIIKVDVAIPYTDEWDNDYRHSNSFKGIR